MSDDFDTVLPMGRSCRSYRIGHRVHWIQGLRSAGTTVVIRVSVAVHPSGPVQLRGDGLSLECWNHTPGAIQASLPRNPDHAVVWWMPEWHVLSFSAHGGGLFSLGSVGHTNAMPCRCATGPGRVHSGFPRAGNEGRPRLHGAWAEPPCPRCVGGLGVSTAAPERPRRRQHCASTGSLKWF
jgi:hypothetical protein